MATLALAFDHLPLGVAFGRLDDAAADIQLLYANALFLQFAQTQDKPAGQLLGPFLQACGSAEPDFVRLCVRVARTGQPDTLERYHERTGRWFSVRAYSPASQHVAVLLEDIGPRRSLEATARLHDAIVRQSDVAIVSQDLQGCITSWNDKACAMFGFTAEEVLGRPLAVGLTAEQVDEDRAVMERVRHGEHIPVVEVRRRHKDGTWMDVLVNVSPILDEAGRVVGISRIGRDITEQKRMEQAAAHSERRMRTIIDVSPIPLALNDAAGRVTFLNAAFTQTFGYTQDDIPGLARWWELAYPNPQYRQWVVDTWGERVQASLRTGRPFLPMEVVVRCKDGTERTVVAAAVDLKGALEDTHLVTLFDITDLVDVRRSLARAENHAEQILQSVGDGLCQFGVDGQVTFINPVGARLLGCRPEDVVGQPAEQFFAVGPVDGTDAHPQTSMVLDAARTGQRTESELAQFSRKDGSRFPVHFVSAPMLVDGAVQGAVLTFRDISLEQQMRRRLLDDEIKIRKAQEMAGFGSYATDLLTGLWESSEQLDSIFGIDDSYPHDIPHWNGLLAPEYQQPALDHYLEVAAGKFDFRMDYEIIRPRDGVRRWVAANGEIERDAQGTPLRLIGTIQDITERKETEIALQRSHDLLMRLSEQVPGVLFRVERDAAGVLSVPYVSNGIEAIAGITAVQLRQDAKAALERVPQDERDMLLASLMSAAESGHDWAWQFRLRMPDGQLLWRSGRARSERRANGSMVWHGILSDATERMQAQQELQQLNESLESRVRQRTSELAIALEQAESAKRSRGEFLAKMSHEIRTPLNAILGLSYLAYKSDPSEKVRAQLEQIRGSGKHLLGIVNDILDFSKIDAGKLVLEVGDFDLDVAIRHVMDLTRVRAAGKELELIERIAPAVPRKLRGDSLRLCQVLINFMGNAIKFTDEGSVELRVLLLPESAAGTEGGCVLRFEVRDTGIGMSEEQQQRMFLSFEQGDNSITRKFGGTGLGLAISKQLVELMGGVVGMDSQVGRGSTFWFTAHLGLTDAKDLPPAAAAGVGVGEGAVSPQAYLRGRHFLVVDDNDFNLDVARGLLDEVGAQSTMASNGAEALLLLQGARFDAVLLDVQMPVMDGVEATRRIRADAALADTCIIAMTANALREDRRRYLAVGMNDVITKPIDPEVFFRTIALRLGLAGAAPVAAPRAVAPQSAAAMSTPAAAMPVEWDEAALARAVGPDAAVHARLLARYLSGSEQQGAALEQALDSKDWLQAGELAHKLKSSSRTVGALALGQWCENLEKAGRAGDGTQCLALRRPLVDALGLARQRAQAAWASAQKTMEGKA